MQTRVLRSFALAALVCAALVSFQPPASALSANPFSGAALFVDPYSNAKKTADSWRASRPADALLMDKIARHASADWFGDWNANVADDVRNRSTQIRNAGALPVFVAYNIPMRDLNWYSAGGASPEGYRKWIREFARGLGDGQAVVILEPDALGHLDAMTPRQRAERVTLLRDAIGVLATKPAVSVYVDAGNPNWLTPQEAAKRLTQLGMDKVRGFALNTSNFVDTKQNIIYGRNVSQLLGGKPFVIDTSRNGQGTDPGGEIINPPGRGLGEAPSVGTGDAVVDAFLWIKRPGESDGNRDGAPPAGSWYADYALGLCKLAIF